MKFSPTGGFTCLLILKVWPVLVHGLEAGLHRRTRILQSGIASSSWQGTLISWSTPQCCLQSFSLRRLLPWQPDTNQCALSYVTLAIGRILTSSLAKPTSALAADDLAN